MIDKFSCRRLRRTLRTASPCSHLFHDRLFQHFFLSKFYQFFYIWIVMTLSSWGILERKGHTRMATFFLTKKVAKDLIGRANYTRIRGIETTQFPAVVREHLRHHGSINNAEVRGLFNLGNSRSASVEASRYLRLWSGEDGFLIREGKPPNTLYRLRDR